LNGELTQTHAEVDHLTENLANRSASLAQQTKDFEDMQQYVAGLQQDHKDELAQYEADFEQLRVKGEAEKEAWSKESTQLKAEHEREQKRLLHELEQAYNEHNAKLDEMSRMESQLAEESAKYDELRQQLTLKHEQTERMIDEMQRGHANELAKSSGELNALGEQCVKLKQQLESLSSSLEACEKEKQAWSEQYGLLQNESNCMLNKLNSEVQALNQAKADLEAQLNSVSQRLNESSEYAAKVVS
jgi:exonuclease SbcC